MSIATLIGRLRIEREAVSRDPPNTYNFQEEICVQHPFAYLNIYFGHLLVISPRKRRGPFLEVLQYQVNPWRRWSKPLTTSPRFKNQFNIEAPV